MIRKRRKNGWGKREAKISAAEVEKLAKRKAKGLKLCKQLKVCSVLGASLAQAVVMVSQRF